MANINAQLKTWSGSVWDYIWPKTVATQVGTDANNRFVTDAQINLWTAAAAGTGALKLAANPAIDASANPNFPAASAGTVYLALVALIQAVANKRHVKADASDINVKTAMELEKMAMARYTDMSQALGSMEVMCSRLKKALEVYENYIGVLQDLLDKNNVSYPPLDKELPYPGKEEQK